MNAIDFILDTVRENPGEIKIIALGPVTKDFDYNVTLVNNVDKDEYFKLYLDAIR